MHRRDRHAFLDRRSSTTWSPSRRSLEIIRTGSLKGSSPLNKMSRFKLIIRKNGTLSVHAVGHSMKCLSRDHENLPVTISTEQTEPISFEIWGHPGLDHRRRNGTRYCFPGLGRNLDRVIDVIKKILECNLSVRIHSNLSSKIGLKSDLPTDVLHEIARHCDLHTLVNLINADESLSFPREPLGKYPGLCLGSYLPETREFRSTHLLIQMPH